MADLSVDTQALAGFSALLKGMVADYSSPLLKTWAVYCDGSLLDELTSLSADDDVCGQSLNNYLVNLAGYLDRAIESTEKLDADLAKSAPTVHGRMLETM